MNDSPVVQRRRRKAGETRAEILRHLAALLTDPQHKRVTTKSLAAALGISEAALYRHFASKAQMFDELINFAQSYFLTAINTITTEEVAGKAQAARIAQLLMNIPNQSPEVIFLIIGDSLNDEAPRLHGAVQVLLGKLQGALRQALKVAVAQQELPADYDAALRASLVMSLVLGHWLQFVRNNRHYQPVGETEQLKIALGFA